MVYFGDPVHSLTYLREIDYACPSGYNAADHWMDLLVVDSAAEDDDDWAEDMSGDELQITRENSTLRRRQSRTHSAAQLSSSRGALIEAWNSEAFAAEIDVMIKNESSAVGGEGANRDEPKFNVSWATQCMVLIHRSMKNSRSAIFTPLNIIKSAVIGISTGLLWFQIDYTEATVTDISGYFFFTMSYWVFESTFSALMAFPNEREIIFKERGSGSYNLSAYFVAKTTSEAPTHLALPFIYMTVSYWMAGINNTFSAFFGSTCITMLSVLAGESLGLAIGASVLDQERAMAIMVVVSLTLLLVGGFFLRGIPYWLEWLRFLSPFKYAFDGVQQIVFDRDVPCDGSGILEQYCMGGNEGYATSEEVLKHLGVQGSVGFNAGLLFLMFLVPRYFAFIMLKRANSTER